MSVGDVSFKSVVAVSGPPRKMKLVKRRLRPYILGGNVKCRNVTQKYVNSPSDGMIARAAQKGDQVEIYITGEEADRLLNDGDSDCLIRTDNLLQYLSSYFNINKMPVDKVVEEIINS